MATTNFPCRMCGWADPDLRLSDIQWQRLARAAGSRSEQPLFGSTNAILFAFEQDYLPSHLHLALLHVADGRPIPDSHRDQLAGLGLMRIREGVWGI